MNNETSGESQGRSQFDPVQVDPERKAALVQQIIDGTTTVAEVIEETGAAKSTVTAWVAKARKAAQPDPAPGGAIHASPFGRDLTAKLREAEAQAAKAANEAFKAQQERAVKSTQALARVRAEKAHLEEARAQIDLKLSELDVEYAEAWNEALDSWSGKQLKDQGHPTPNPQALRRAKEKKTAPEPDGDQPVEQGEQSPNGGGQGTYQEQAPEASGDQGGYNGSQDSYSREAVVM